MAQPKEEKNAESTNPQNTQKMTETYMQRVHTFEKTTRFPLESNSILFGGFNPDEVHKHMRETYPLCHGGVLSVAHQFLLAKREFGSSVEKELYQEMTLTELFDRISTKRAIVFYQKYDSYMLRNGTKGANAWEAIGTDFENIDGNGDNSDTPLLKDYLSYDELLLSALCGISSQTHFINNGNRHNKGRVNPNDKTYPMQAVYMGLIGARFEKQYIMEYALMVISADQNKKSRGYGLYEKAKNKDLNRLQKAISDEYFIKQIKASKEVFKESKPIIRNIFESFYSRDYFPLYEEVSDQKQESEMAKRYFEDSRRYGNQKPFMDLEMFRRRIRVSLELFLFDSDKRCSKANKNGFCHLVGLGSGYWAFNKTEQDKQIVNVVMEIIKDTQFNSIKYIYFSWFDEECEDMLSDNNMFSKNNRKIEIEFGDRNPADELEEEIYGKECLVCACYAWDSNAFPGNEYWLGNLNASGDPAAAACSTISYIQNAQINQEYVSGDHTMFYFFDPNTGKYEFIKLKDIDFENNKEKWLTKSVLSIPYKRKSLSNL